MQHARDLGPRFEPARDPQAGLVVMGEPHAHRAQAAQTEIDVVGTDAEPERVHGRCRRGQVASLADTVPSITSEWPPIYLVPAWIERSTPFSKARK